MKKLENERVLPKNFADIRKKVQEKAFFDYTSMDNEARGGITITSSYFPVSSEDNNPRKYYFFSPELSAVLPANMESSHQSSILVKK